MYHVKIIFSEIELFNEYLTDSELMVFLKKLGVLDNFKYIFNNDVSSVYKFVNIDNVSVFFNIRKIEPFIQDDFDSIIIDSNDIVGLFLFEPTKFYSLYLAIQDLFLDTTETITLSKLGNNSYKIVTTDDKVYILKFINTK